MEFDDAMKDAAQLDMRLMPYELAGNMAGTRDIFSKVESGASLGVFIGPEGGFDEKEVSKASENGFVPITLGRRILRTETAAMTVMSWLVFLFDDKA